MAKDPKPKKGVNPKSLANLRPNLTGAVTNPYGPKGKNGTGGFSLKTALKKQLSELSDVEKDKFFVGLIMRALKGDEKSIRLILEMNDEITKLNEVQNALGVLILPSKIKREEDSSVE